MLPSRDRGERDRVAGMLAVRARVARLHENRLVVAGGADDREAAAVARHRQELTGTPVAGETATARRMLVEWVGEPSPLDSPLLMALTARGVLFADERAQLRRASLLRKARVDGLTSRTLTAERDRMTETICWGPHPGTYVRALAYADARRIFDDPQLAHEFVIVEDEERARGRMIRPDRYWLAAINAMRAGANRPPVAADHVALAVTYEPEFGLKKIDGHGRVGLWSPYYGR
jgi:hypothetical protein